MLRMLVVSSPAILNRIMYKQLLSALLILGSGCLLTLMHSGCAQIGMPTGGPRDSLAPVLVKANPDTHALRFTGNKITLTFNEYIELKDISNYLMVAPFPKVKPVISSNLKTLTIRLKDTLKPNTTYHIQFGDAIQDVNEYNPLKNFAYTFSTGDYIDSLSVAGKILLAESGKADSTLQALLYRESPDSAVQTRKPDYVARVNGDGSFRFNFLPPGQYQVYALKDGDGGKTYNSKKELFGFTNQPVSSSLSGGNEQIYAFSVEKDPGNNSRPTKEAAEKKLRYETNMDNGRQDILQPFQLSFNNKLKKIDTASIVITDTLFNPIANQLLTVDSTRKKIRIAVNWKQDESYVLLLPKDAIADTLKNGLLRNDTIAFKTKRESDYGSVVLRFKNLDLTKHPVLLFIQQDQIKLSAPLTGSEYRNKLFPPGEYEIRILFDNNQNGQWDPGNYTERRQPEIVQDLNMKLAFRGDWENERDIDLK